jgi:hypothetical protein
MTVTGTVMIFRTSDVPFLLTNDRYQAVALSYAGSTTTDPEFRYWFTAAPMWDLDLAGDMAHPPYHTLDENSHYPEAALELPFKDFKTGQEVQIDGIQVEFYERPTAVTETQVISTYTVGFTARVEAVSVDSWSRSVTTTLTSGVIVSDSQTYVSTAETVDSDNWPNLRTAYLPIRLAGKCRAARVIFSDVHLCAIRRVQLVGKAMASRNP